MKTVEDDLKEFQKKENERLDAEREYKESISDERKLKNIASFLIFLSIVGTIGGIITLFENEVLGLSIILVSGTLAVNGFLFKVVGNISISLKDIAKKK